jgi:predicted nucleotidyltransferase
MALSGFTKSVNWNVLFDRQGQEVDLLPFGAIDMDGRKLIDSQGLVSGDVSGFNEVYENAIKEVEFEGHYQFKVSTLAGIVILKLIAYDDRPEMRSNDIKDIGLILSYYFDLESDVIYESHADLFSDEENNLEQIAARVLGRQMQKIIGQNRLLKRRIVNILQKGTALSKENRMAVWLLNSSIVTVEQAIALIREVITGLNEELSI